jgi:SAM-dependent methyltransferase
MDQDLRPLVPFVLFFTMLGIREMRRRKQGRATIEAADRVQERLARLQPPRDVHDAAAWDRYWDNQRSDPMLAGMQLMCAEMFCDLRPLVAAMRSKGMTSILCVGHGLSREPAMLARAGFSVVGLDLSPLVSEWCQGFVLDDNSLPGLIDADQEAPGGRVEYVAGDLTDPRVCPGPFDVIIERRTVQLFGEANGQALDALAAHLNTPGIFLSHCHDGCWRPPQPRTHANAQWFLERGWTHWSDRPPQEISPAASCGSSSPRGSIATDGVDPRHAPRTL